jgi:hypothetical protein
MAFSLLLYALFLGTNVFGVVFLSRIASDLRRIADNGTKSPNAE